MENTSTRISPDVQKRKRGRPHGSGTKGREGRLSHTVALSQSIMRGAVPGETPSEVERRLCEVMDAKGVQDLFESGGGKRLRAFLNGETPLMWDGLATLTKAGRAAGYLTKGDNDLDAFLDDLQTPNHFSQAIESRTRIDNALGNLFQSALALKGAIEDGRELADIDQTAIEEMRHEGLVGDPMQLRAGILYDGAQLVDFDIDVLLTQLSLLSVRLAHGASRASPPAPRLTLPLPGLHDDISAVELEDFFENLLLEKPKSGTNLAQRSAKNE